MRQEPIVISGLGAVSAAGKDCVATLANFLEGEQNAGPVTLFDTDIAKPVFEVGECSDDGDGVVMRTLKLAFRAVDEALADARLSPPFPSMRIGVCLGTTVAAQLNDLDFYKTFRAEGSAPTGAIERYLNSNLSAAIAKHYDCSGPKLTIVNACSSGTDAVGMAASWLRGGLCDIAITGGADELNRVPISGFNSLSVMSELPCAPFDANRSGLNLGEGAGVLILETAESAAERGISSELHCLGYGTFGDAHHLTAPREDGSGLHAAISCALEESGLRSDNIAFVNAHGTATPTNDRVEGAVLATMFGSGCPVLSTKGFTGHTLGAAGGLEAVFCAMGLREQWVPRTAGFKTPDPEIPLVPTTETTTIRGSYALSTSLAFGGNNSALILGRVES